MASTGHRGRVDARGQPVGGAPSLTRTSGQDVGAPSRVRRGVTPSASRCLASAPGDCLHRRFKTTNAPRHRWPPGEQASPAAPQALRIVHHEKERRLRDPWFASSPALDVDAGRGHRRGLDGPTMPKQSLKMESVFLHPPRWWRGEVGGGLFRRRLRHVLGIGGTYTKAPGAACSRCADESQPNAQGNRGRPGPISDGRTPEKQAPAHLAARDTSARAKRDASASEAQHVRTRQARRSMAPVTM